MMTKRSTLTYFYKAAFMAMFAGVLAMQNVFAATNNNVLIERPAKCKTACALNYKIYIDGKYIRTKLRVGYTYGLYLTPGEHTITSSGKNSKAFSFVVTENELTKITAEIKRKKTSFNMVFNVDSYQQLAAE